MNPTTGTLGTGQRFTCYPMPREEVSDGSLT